jgi:hypothetical protein
VQAFPTPHSRGKPEQVACRSEGVPYAIWLVVPYLKVKDHQAARKKPEQQARYRVKYLGGVRELFTHLSAKDTRRVALRASLSSPIFPINKVL